MFILHTALNAEILITNNIRSKIIDLKAFWRWVNALMDWGEDNLAQVLWISRKFTRNYPSCKVTMREKQEDLMEKDISLDRA
jgi:hypothetical protein